MTDLDRRFEAILREYDALREEIKYRTQFQQALVAVNLAAVGVLLGVARVQTEFLLAIAYVSPILGLYYFDHDIVIRNLGRYISNDLRQVAGELGASNAFAWEGNVLFRPGRSWRVVFWFLVLALFVLPVAVVVPWALAWAEPKLVNETVFLAFGAGATLATAVSAAAWISRAVAGPR